MSYKIKTRHFDSLEKAEKFKNNLKENQFVFFEKKILPDINIELMTIFYKDFCCGVCQETNDKDCESNNKSN